MAGASVSIFAKREFNFDNGASEIVVVKAAPVLDWMSGLLAVRVHDEAVGGTSSMRVMCFITAPTPMDPSQDFVASTALATVLINRLTPAPTLLVDPFAGNPGAYLRVVVVGSPAAGTCSATLSATFEFKD